ncbi:hypothetical protein [Rurimicrobium arvi]|uniref:Secreted protein n=1 Tax=Rurimicrobium arvi TaxID=2049916 RepID=A0ABP8MNK9_9BACT
MKNSALAFVFIPLVCIACNPQKAAPMSEARKQQIIDSIVRAREQEIREIEEENLRDRMSIELKVKADSLLALRHPAIRPVVPKKDTVRVDTASQAALSDTTGKQPN